MVDLKYPPCGRLCKVCEAKKEGICSGCIETKGKPEVLKEAGFSICPLWECVKEKELDHCGNCSEFPCEEFLEHYNPERGKRSVLPYIGLLSIRKQCGIEEWKKWARINKEKE